MRTPAARFLAISRGVSAMRSAGDDASTARSGATGAHPSGSVGRRFGTTQAASSERSACRSSPRKNPAAAGYAKPEPGCSPSRTNSAEIHPAILADVPLEGLNATISPLIDSRCSGKSAVARTSTVRTREITMSHAVPGRGRGHASLPPDLPPWTISPPRRQPPARGPRPPPAASADSAPGWPPPHPAACTRWCGGRAAPPPATRPLPGRSGA
jgi:hypothetical protein